MIETVTSVELSVQEHLVIQKNRIEPVKSKEQEKRISIVTGTHGDELEGQYVCYEVNRRIAENKEALNGIVDIYPALNPLGIDSITRGIPMYDLDMNRSFPGSEKGNMPEAVASAIVGDIAGSDVCVDIHASNIFLMEIPQVRINEETAEKLVPMAKFLNVDLVWVHASATVLESTLAHSLNCIGVPTLVVEMGVGMRITKKYTDQLVDGLFRLMKEMGMWNGPVSEVREPIISTDREVSYVNANATGMFIPVKDHGATVKKGEHIGDIISGLTGEIEETVSATADGLLFTIREYPVVYSGSLLARIIGGCLS